MPRPTHPYVRTWEGWLYLATVLDVFSRRVIGWALTDHLRASLVCDAPRMAVATRGGSVAGVIFHSDRGCQYTAAEFRDLCDTHRVQQSMGRTGVCWDSEYMGAMLRDGSLTPAWDRPLASVLALSRRLSIPWRAVGAERPS